MAAAAMLDFGKLDIILPRIDRFVSNFARVYNTSPENKPLANMPFDKNSKWRPSQFWISSVPILHNGLMHYQILWQGLHKKPENS